MVRVARQPERMVDEALVKGQRQRPERHAAASQLVKDVLQAFDLRLVLRQDAGTVAAPGQ